MVLFGASVADKLKGEISAKDELWILREKRGLGLKMEVIGKVTRYVRVLAMLHLHSLHTFFSLSLLVKGQKLMQTAIQQGDGK